MLSLPGHSFCQEIPDSPTFASLGDRITLDLLPLVSQTREGTLMLVLETLQRTLALGSVQQNGQLCNQFVSTLILPVVNGSLKSEWQPVMTHLLNQLNVTR
jgi:hypothetical protein